MAGFDFVYFVGNTAKWLVGTVASYHHSVRRPFLAMMSPPVANRDWVEGGIGVLPINRACHPVLGLQRWESDAVQSTPSFLPEANTYPTLPHQASRHSGTKAPDLNNSLPHPSSSYRGTDSCS